MNFRQLEAFRAVMSHGTVIQAAEAMNITQPAVSRLIVDFEAGLAISLFQRQRGRLKPTAEAHLLFQESDMAFSGLARLREAATVMKEIRRGRIRIISETVYAEGLLPRLIARYHKLHPDVHIELDIGPSARISDWIAETWYDIGLVVMPVANTDINTHVFQCQRAVCAMPKGHPLAGRATINLANLEGERFIAPVAGTPFRLLIDSALKRAGIKPDIRIEARSQHSICSFVEAGAGLALIDPAVKQNMISSNIIIVPCEPKVFWDIAFVTPKARKLSLACQDFLDFLLSVNE